MDVTWCDLRPTVCAFTVSVAAATLGGAFVVTPAVAAQVDLELVPYAGVYIPTQKLVDQFTSSCNCQLSLKQKGKVALGGRLTVWWTSHLGAEPLSAIPGAVCPRSAPRSTIALATSSP